MENFLGATRSQYKLMADKRCSGCGEMIGYGKYQKRPSGLFYHKGCFKCSDCRVPIEGSFSPGSSKDTQYCLKCAQERLNNKKGQGLRTRPADPASGGNVLRPGSNCPTCGGANTKGSKFCGECGASLQQQFAYCGECGKKYQVGTEKFCGDCGTKHEA